ncbi:MAG: sigma-70 family RNA polymerase sigma factor [Planctomycetota bacterium]
MTEKLSGVLAVSRSNDTMPLSTEDILGTLMKSRDRISAAVWLIVHDTQTAEDIFQNVALKAISKNVTFEVEAAVLSWAFITARHEGIDWLRRRKHETAFDVNMLELLERDWVDETREVADTRSEALRKCLQGIPEKSRQLLKLRYFDGHACQEVADRLGAKLNAIYKRLSRLHHGLKDCIELRMSEAEVLDA